MAKLTIIIPSYNHSTFLIDRLETISKQTYKDWEAIIIDDKSSDNSVEIINMFLEKNQHFKVKHFIVNDINSQSGYNSWKKGIELADTKYIWIAETDDYSDENFLKEQVEILEMNNNATLSFCTSNYVDNNDIVLFTSQKRTQDLDVGENQYKIFDGDVLLKKMPFETYITNGSSVVFRKPEKAIPEIIFLNRLSSDLFLWTFLVQKRSFAFLNKNLNYFRQHNNSTSYKLHKQNNYSLYLEKVKYINFFNQPHKLNQFIEYYIEYYVWNNKKDVMKMDFIRLIKSDQNLTLIYFSALFRFFWFKVRNKLKYI